MKSKQNGRSANVKPDGSGVGGSLPFSRPVAVDSLPENGLEVAIEADAAERAALAKLNGLVDIAKLDAAFEIKRRPQGRVNVRGRVTAEITQTCVVSLEPFESAVLEEVDVDFMHPDDIEKAERKKLKAREQVKPGEEEEADPPDPIVDGKIDLGVLAAEFLALALDPYPRKPGVAFEDILPQTPEERESPFAILRKWDKTS